MILGCLYSIFRHPLGIHIQSTRSVQQRPAVNLLAFLAEQPVYKNLRGVGVRRILEYRQTAITVARRSSLTRFGQALERQPGFDERFSLRGADAERKSYLAFAQRFGKLPQILRDEEILLHKFFEIFLALHITKIGPHGQARARHARIAETALAFPFGVEKIIERTKFLTLGEGRVVPESFVALGCDERIEGQ